MPQKRTLITVWLLVLLGLGFYLGGWLSEQSDFERLVGARRSELRYRKWQDDRLYRLFVRLTKFDPVNHFRHKADGLEKSLLKSGGLTEARFYQGLNWLNDGTAAGWKVGLMSWNAGNGESKFVASRRR